MDKTQEINQMLPEKLTSQFSKALDAIAALDDERQRHFMFIVAKIAECYAIDDHQAVLLLSDQDALQVASINANELEACQIVEAGSTLLLGAAEMDRPEHLN